MKAKWGVAVGYGALIWVIGFVWGTVVFMTPALKEVPSIPLFSRYPVISFPLLLLFPWLAYRWAPKSATPPPATGAFPPIGFIFVIVNLLLDYVVLVQGFKNDQYFFFLSVWLCYAGMVVTAQSALRQAAGPPAPPA